MIKINRGMSITSVMMAIALAGMLAIFLGNLLRNTMQAVRGVSDSVGKKTVEQLFDVVLGNQDTCFKTFASLKLDNIEAPIKLIDLSDRVLMQDGDKSNGWLLNQISAKSGPVPTSGIYFATLTVRMTRIADDSQSIGAKSVTFKRHVNLVTVGGKLTQCLMGPAGTMSLVNLRQHIGNNAGPTGYGLTIGYVPDPTFSCPSAFPPVYCFVVPGFAWRDFVNSAPINNARGNLWKIVLNGDVSASGHACIHIKATIRDVTAGNVDVGATEVGYGCDKEAMISNTLILPNIVVGHDYSLRFSMNMNTSDGMARPGDTIGTFGAEILELEEWVRPP